MFDLFKKKTIFDIARETGKKIAFIIFEDKIFITLAEKTVDGKVKLKIYKNYKWLDLEVQVEPSQEFTIHTPRISMMKIKNVFNYLMNREFMIASPSDVFFAVEPYDVEGIIIVYPYEVLSREAIKLLGLRDKKEMKEVDLSKIGIREKKLVKVYSPTLFAIDKHTIKMISARSRISQIDTILTMLKELMVKSEGLMKAPFAGEGIKNLLMRREFWIMIILIGALAILAMFLPKMIGIIGSAAKPPILLPTNFTSTFP